MHSLLLRSHVNVHKSPSLQAFQAYRESEAHNSLQTSVSSDGELLEYETLELRVHPPNIDINNNHPTRSIITVDSANRPGTLIEVLSFSDVDERIFVPLHTRHPLESCHRLCSTSQNLAWTFEKPVFRQTEAGSWMVSPAETDVAVLAKGWAANPVKLV